MITVTRAKNDTIIDTKGRRYIDLSSGNGAVLLGHAVPEINRTITKQMDRIAIAGNATTDITKTAFRSIDSYLLGNLTTRELYVTGMEAAECAMRIARVVTGKKAIIGFSRSTHGKSLATAYLGWPRRDGIFLQSMIRLPFLHECSEEVVLRQLEGRLIQKDVAAVFFEPIQSSGGGRSGSTQFYNKAMTLCRKYGALVVFDEVLTGFYRTGTPFFFQTLDRAPDILLIGKALANGFPVAGVVTDRKYRITDAMYPGSTYANSPLVAAAIVGTLRYMRTLPMKKLVRDIEAIIQKELAPLHKCGLDPRGRGALWVIELPKKIDPKKIAAHLERKGVLVSCGGDQLRIMPAATIDPVKLQKACGVVRKELERVLQ